MTARLVTDVALGLAIWFALGIVVVIGHHFARERKLINYQARGEMPSPHMPDGIPWPPPPAAAVTRTQACGCVTLLDPPGTIPCHTHAEVIPQP